MRSSERLVAAAASRGLKVEVRAFPDGMRTAHDAAAAIGCDEPVVALVGGSDRLDEERLAMTAGARVRRARADEVRDATGYAMGGVPPFGHSKELRCFADDALLTHDVVWAAAGTPIHVFASAPDELILAADAQVVTIRHTAP